MLLGPARRAALQRLSDADRTLLAVATTVGVLAAVVQFLGLVRWPFLVPYLARVDAEPDASAARHEAVDIVFLTFNRYLGEHLGSEDPLARARPHTSREQTKVHHTAM